MTDFTVFLDLAKEVQPPDKGILSRTLFSDDRLDVADRISDSSTVRDGGGNRHNICQND